MKKLLALAMVLPLLVGCMTSSVVQVGKREEFFTSYESVKVHEGRYVVVYTVETRAHGSKKVLESDKRLELITPSTGESLAIKEYPEWYKDATNIELIPIHGLFGTGYVDKEIARYSAGRHGIAFAITEEVVRYSSLLIPTDPSNGNSGKQFHFGPVGQRYRKLWGYPACIFGVPVAVTLDVVTLPVQLLMTRQALKNWT